MPAPRVALVSGFWGQNIGNAFFNIGGKWILDQVFGPENVAFIQDQPGYRTFHNQGKGNPRNDFGLLKYLDIDYIVLQGPCLTETFGSLWHETFAALTSRGTKIILLGSAFFRYTKNEINAARDVIGRFPPLLIVTRDSKTYEIIKNWIPYTHDGIDSAFFVPDAYKPLKLNTTPYITFNFDRYLEPTIKISSLSEAPRVGDVYNFEELEFRWSLTTPKLQNWLANQGKAIAYFGHFLDRRRLPKILANHVIVRPEHRFNPHITRKIYQHPNAIASDEPFTYFNIYAGSKMTLSDRVHACVITLAYGNPAMLFTPTPRAALFDRLYLNAIRERPQTLDLRYLQQEKCRELSFLKSILN